MLVVGQEQVFHLLEMDIGTRLGKRRVWIRMGDVLAGEERDVAIGAVHVFFYRGDSMISKGVSCGRPPSCNYWNSDLPMRMRCSFHHSFSSSEPPSSASLSHHAPFRRMYSSRRLCIFALRSSSEESHS